MAESKLIFKCKHIPYKNSCKLCGSYLHNNEVIKSQRFKSNFHTSNNNYLSNLRKRSTEICKTPKLLNQQTFILLENICQKFQFCLETLALAIYYYQYLKEKQYSNMRDINYYSHESQEKFLTSVCLMVAGKAMELDKKVPYFNRFQRYAEKTKTKEQYQLQQRLICQHFNFNLQYSTFVTFLNFYLTTGIMFRNDNINENAVILIEEQIMIKAKEMVREGIFAKNLPQSIAISIIKQVRKKYDLQAWPRQLDLISGSFRPKNYDDKILQPIKTQRNMGISPALELKYITLRNKKKPSYQTSIKQNQFADSYKQHSNTLTKSLSIKGSNSYSCANFNNIFNVLGTRKRL